MRSLQMKFSALVVALLLVACVGLAWIATQHERASLESEVAKRGAALAENLARNAREPLLAGQELDQLTLEGLVQAVGRGEGVVAARILGRDGRVEASLDPQERGAARPPIAGDAAPSGGVVAARTGSLLAVAAPVVFSDVRVGEAQVALDLHALVDPVVRSSRRQLALVAVGVIALGMFAGVVFVAFLVGPLRRLRAAVERLTAGDFTVRIPPPSRDEVGDLARAFNEMGESLQQKERIQNAFGRYVSEHVLTQLLQTPEGSDELIGAEREVTIVFIDIRRFTRLSEGMKAREVVRLLNDFFQLAADRILARGGTIDKFIGDSLMAYFGAPVPQSDHALRAVTAAIDVAQAAAERQRTRRADADGIPPIQIGVGIHTGVVVVGNIGSDRRMDFTAIGDAVNVAHRLEKLAAPGEILVSEAVQRRVRGAVKLRFEGERQLSGRQEPVHVYAVDLGGPPPEPEPA